MPTDRTQQLAHAYRQLAADLRRQLLASHRAFPTHVDDGLSFAWLRAYELAHVHLGDLDRLRGWLYTTAIREIQRLDRNARRDHRPDERPDGLTDFGASQTPSPDRHVIARQDLAEFAATAKPREAQALGLQALGYSHTEIAQLLGCTPRTVDRLLVRGRARTRSTDV